MYDRLRNQPTNAFIASNSQTDDETRVQNFRFNEKGEFRIAKFKIPFQQIPKPGKLSM